MLFFHKGLGKADRNIRKNGLAKTQSRKILYCNANGYVPLLDNQALMKLALVRTPSDDPHKSSWNIHKFMDTSINRKTFLLKKKKKFNRKTFLELIQITIE